MDARIDLLDGFTLATRAARGPRAEVDLPMASRRVVAFLAIEGRSRGRAYVAYTLWPEVPEARAQQSLRTALWEIQQRVPGLMKSERGDIGLVGGTDVDVDRMTLLARNLTGTSSRDLERMVDLYAHEVLPDWYDDWLVPARERWRGVRMHALDRLSELLRDTSAGSAVDAAVAAVSVEPLRESSRRALILAYQAEGNYAQAAQELGRFRTILREELGMEPSSDLTALVALPQGGRATGHGSHPRPDHFDPWMATTPLSGNRSIPATSWQQPARTTADEVASPTRLRDELARVAGARLVNSMEALTGSSPGARRSG